LWLKIHLFETENYWQFSWVPAFTFVERTYTARRVKNENREAEEYFPEFCEAKLLSATREARCAAQGIGRARGPEGSTRSRREWSEAEPWIARFFAVKPQKMRPNA
jgi:hypothetical protein